MERYERELETDAGDHERQRADQQTGILAHYLGADIVEIERASRECVYERKSHKKYRRREYSREDVFDGGLVALVVSLVEGDERCERKRRRLETDQEEQEVS